MKVIHATLCNLAGLQGTFSFSINHPSCLTTCSNEELKTDWGKFFKLYTLSLALYAKLPDNSTSSTFHSLVSSNCEEGYAKVEFEGKDQKTYIATLHIQKKQFGTKSIYKHFLQPSNSQHHTAINQANATQQIAELLPLSYENFQKLFVYSKQNWLFFLQANELEKKHFLQAFVSTKHTKQITQHINRNYQDFLLQYRLKKHEVEFLSQDLLPQQEYQLLEHTLQKKQTRKKHLQDILNQIKQQKKWIKNYDEVKLEKQTTEEICTALQKKLQGLSQKQIELDRYDLLSFLQPSYIGVKLLATQKQNSWEEIEKLQKEEEKLHAEAEDSLHEKLTQEKALHEVLYRNQERRSFIRKGLFIQGEQKNLLQQLEQLSKAISLEEEQLKQKELEAKRALSELEDERKKNEELTQQNQELARKKHLWNNYQTLKSLFNNLFILLQEQEELKKQINENNTTIHHFHQKYNNIQQELTNNKQQFQILVEKIRVEKLRIKGKSLSQLEQVLIQHQNKVTSLQAAMDLWKHIALIHQKLRDKQMELQRNEDRMVVLKKKLETLYTEKRDFEKTFKTTQQHYLLSSGKSIEELRKYLVKGKACTVCGSTHHPYHLETVTEMDILYHEFHQKVEESERNLIRKTSELERLIADIAYLEAINKELKEIIAYFHLQQKESYAIWEKYATLDPAISACSSSVDDSSRLVTIQLLIESNENQIKNITQDIALIHATNENLKTFNKAIKNLFKEEENLTPALEKSLIDYQFHKTQKEEQSQRLIVVENRINLLTKELDYYIGDNTWSENKSNFVTQLKIGHRAWNSYIQNTTSTTERINEITRKLDRLQTDILNKTSFLKKQKENYDIAHKRHLLLSEELNTTATFLNFEQEEKEMQGKELELKAKITQLADEYQQRFTQWQQIKGKLLGLTHFFQQLQNTYAKEKLHLDTLISKFNKTYSPTQEQELEYLFQQTDWVQLREEIKTIHLSIKENNTLLNQIQNTFNGLLASVHRTEASIEDLTEQEALIMQEKINVEQEIERLFHKHKQQTLLINQLNVLEAELLKKKTMLQQWEELQTITGKESEDHLTHNLLLKAFEKMISIANKHLSSQHLPYKLQTQKDSFEITLLHQLKGNKETALYEISEREKDKLCYCLTQAMINC